MKEQLEIFKIIVDLTTAVVPPLKKAINAFQIKSEFCFEEADMIALLVRENDIDKVVAKDVGGLFISDKSINKYNATCFTEFNIQFSGEKCYNYLSPYLNVINASDGIFPDINCHINYDEELSSNKLEKRSEIISEYIKVNNKSNLFNGTALRLSSLTLDEGGYFSECHFIKYLDQLGTNLSIDYEENRHTGSTLRDREIGSAGEPLEFEQSKMANSIGVAAIVYFRRNGKRYFWCKPRSLKVAIEQGILGSPSGVVSPVYGQTITNLTQFLYSEMIREFSEETGLPVEVIRNIKFLNLSRELRRGGKPQAFFLIEIDDLKDSDFINLFRTSPDGLNEFVEQPKVIRKSKQMFSKELVHGFLLSLPHLK